jgi:EAL domain-containing protein (putative c-di-GMP-specific phosphodiesterase class I)
VADLELLEDRFELAAYANRRGSIGMAVLAVAVAGPPEIDELVLQRMTRCLRRTDTVVRTSPLRHIVLLERLAEGPFAMHAADAIVQALRQPFTTPAGPVKAVASVGISVHPDDGDSIDELVTCANAALEAAQASGGDLFGFYSGSLSAAAGRRVALERALPEAIERGQLHLAYQPQLDSRDGSLVGVEALLRWNHPSFGPVSPAEFVPVLENLGLIVEVGTWVLGVACRQATRWELRVGVNVSAHQVRTPDFGDRVREALDQAGLRPQRLELELTESVLLEDATHVREVLSGLRRDGVRVALDDFGTHYASFAYLRQFPMDTIKIDRQFVSGLPMDVQNAAITNAIVSLGRSLSLDVVAEGVEQEAEEEFLHSLDCYVVQGFRYARPMLPADFEAWRKARPWA